MKSLAKQLIQVRSTKERLQKCTSKIGAVAVQAKTMASTAVMAESCMNIVFLIFLGN